jgi:hypothetical protein
MPKAKGGNPNLPTGNIVEPVETLSGLGIRKRQSSEWKKLAAVPQERFEAVHHGTAGAAAGIQGTPSLNHGGGTNQKVAPRSGARTHSALGEEGESHPANSPGLNTHSAAGNGYPDGLNAMLSSWHN